MRVSILFRTRHFAAALTGALVLIGSTTLASAPTKPAWLSTFTASSVGGHIIGNPNAPTKLVEYASYTCSHCAQFETTEAPVLKSQHVANGNVSFEIRNLVRDPLDLTAALLARCGGKGRFFGNHRQLMTTQSKWANGDKISDATAARLDAKDVVGFMKGAYAELGLDKVMQARGVTVAQGKACLADAAALKQVIAMTEEATGKLGLTGTPSFLVNGKQVNAFDVATLKPFLTQ
jgi:protein-disulfide isomerase